VFLSLECSACVIIIFYFIVLRVRCIGRYRNMSLILRTNSLYLLMISVFNFRLTLIMLISACHFSTTIAWSVCRLYRPLLTSLHCYYCIRILEKSSHLGVWRSGRFVDQRSPRHLLHWVLQANNLCSIPADTQRSFVSYTDSIFFMQADSSYNIVPRRRDVYSNLWVAGCTCRKGHAESVLLCRLSSLINGVKQARMGVLLYSF